MKRSPLDSSDPRLYDVTTHARGPAGRLPFQADWLRGAPSGDAFGWTQDAVMGWSPASLGSSEFLILRMQGGMRAPDGTPVALGYHVGHWEIALLAQAAAEELTRLGAIPFAGFVSDLCDGRTQGTVGMMNSLAYRNDAAAVLRRLIRSLPTRRGVSSGACIGHVGPEALADGPLGGVRDGDAIEAVVDRINLTGRVDLVGAGDRHFDPNEGARILSERSRHPDLQPNPNLPDDTRLWAALQNVSGGTWGGCVYDVERNHRTVGRPIVLLTRHQTEGRARWACDGRWLPAHITLGSLLELRWDAMAQLLATFPRDEPVNVNILAPIDPMHEVWAAGVTYRRSRDARRVESQVAGLYDRVHDGARPELFFKAIGWRVVGSGMPIRIRADSRWNVPEPELVVVVNSHREIIGYCAGRDRLEIAATGEIAFLIHAPGATVEQIQGDCWRLPRITLNVSADASSVDVQRRGDLIEVRYGVAQNQPVLCTLQCQEEHL